MQDSRTRDETKMNNVSQTNDPSKEGFDLSKSNNDDNQPIKKSKTLFQKMDSKYQVVNLTSNIEESEECYSQKELMAMDVM